MSREIAVLDPSDEPVPPRDAPLPVTALRALAHALDAQRAAAWRALQSNARLAAALGWPDCAPVVEALADESSALCASVLEPFARAAHRIVDDARALQGEAGRFWEGRAELAAGVFTQAVDGWQRHAGAEWSEWIETAREHGETMTRIGERLEAQSADGVEPRKMAA